MKELPQVVLDSAVDLEFCSGNLIVLEKVAPNLSYGLITTAGHCIKIYDPENVRRPIFIRQPQKNNNKLAISYLEAEYANSDDWTEDFGILAVLIEGDAFGLKPLGLNNVQPGNSTLSVGDMSYGLAFPDGLHNNQPLVGPIQSIEYTNTAIMNYPSVGGSSGAGIFTDGKLTHIHNMGWWNRETGPWEGAVPIPENYLTIISTAKNALEKFVAENLPQEISPEFAIPILDKEILPSILDLTYTIDLGGETQYHQRVGVALSSPDTGPNIFHFLSSISSLDSNWGQLTITNKNQPDLNLTIHHDPYLVACSNEIFCGVSDPGNTLESSIPQIPDSLLLPGKILPQILFTLDYNHQFQATGWHRNEYDFPVIDKDTIPGSPIIVFDKDQKWRIIGVHVSSTEKDVFFSPNIQTNTHESFETVNRFLE